jgi:molecular chaperone GrpE
MTDATNRPVDDLFADAAASPGDPTATGDQDHHDGIPAPTHDDSATTPPVGTDEATATDPDDTTPGDSNPDEAAIDWEARAEEDGRTRAELLEALMTTQVERDDWLDQLRRKQAEFDNFRKRMARDAQRQRQVGKEAVALAVLDVLDDFDRTVAALEGDEASRKGVELVRDKLVVALGGQGLERMEAAGTPFDPNLHEAVQQVPGEGDEPIVAQVLRSGWTMHDRVLRPAMVVVAQ